MDRTRMSEWNTTTTSIAPFPSIKLFDAEIKPANCSSARWVTQIGRKFGTESTLPRGVSVAEGNLPSAHSGGGSNIPDNTPLKPFKRELRPAQATEFTF